MNIDVTKLTDEELKNLITNHQNKDAHKAPIYLDALREQAKRRGKGLDFDKSFAVIRAAAAEGRFLSYKELAEASGAEWSSV